MRVLNLDFTIPESRYTEFESVLLDIASEHGAPVDFDKKRRAKGLHYKSLVEFETEEALKEFLSGNEGRYLVRAIEALAIENLSKVWQKTFEIALTDYMNSTLID